MKRLLPKAETAEGKLLLEFGEWSVVLFNGRITGKMGKSYLQ